MTQSIIFAGDRIGDRIEDWGIIPSFLDTEDPRPARAQFDAHYGWRGFPGVTFIPETKTLTYPGYPPLEPIGGLWFRNELLLLFDFAWTVIVEPDDIWRVVRLDDRTKKATL
jgi:hypothetical protein